MAARRGKGRGRKPSQDVLPLLGVSGCLMRMRGGRTNVAIRMAGSNDALSTYDQRVAEAEALASCVRTVNWPASICRLPKSVDANESLVLIDAQADALRRSLAQERDEGRAKALAARLGLLSKHVRPAAEREALAGGGVAFATYVVMAFPAGIADSTALRDARIFIDHANSLGRGARLCDASEVVELLQLYFTPKRVDADAVRGLAPVLPAGKGRRARRGAPHSDPFVVAAVAPDIVEGRASLQADELCVRALTVTNFQSQVDVGWADALLNQPDTPVCIRLEPFDGSALLEGIDQHMGQTEDKLLGRTTASQRDELARQRRHGEKMLELAGDEGERFFMATVTCVLRAASPEQLDRDTEYFRSACKARGMNFKVIPNNQLAGYLGASPLRAPDDASEQQAARPFPSRTIGWSLFCQNPGIDDGHGIRLGHDSAGGLVRENVVVASNGRPNHNMLVLGETGCGKSALAKHLFLMEYLVYGSKVIIFDPEGEFVDLCRALGGDVVRPGTKSAAKLSPFQPRAISYSDDEDDEDDAAEQLVLLSTLPFVKSFLKIAFTIEDGLLESLEVALERTYAGYGIDKDTTFSEYRERSMSYPVMEDLYRALGELAEQGSPAAAEYGRLAQKVRTAAVGIQAALWNSRSTLGLDADFIVIDTESMSDEGPMKQAQYYNLLSWVWSEARLAPRTGRPIRIGMDEAHTVVNDQLPAAADMVRSMIKRIRKRDGGMTIITQEVNDMLAENIAQQGAAICNNCTYKFFGRSEADNLEAVKRLYRIEDDLAERIRSAPRGEFAHFAGTDRTWLDVDIEPWEFELFGSKGGR